MLELEALQTAVTFSTIDANSSQDNSINWESSTLELATTETSILSVTPVAALTGGASIRRGGPINSRMVGGQSKLIIQPAPEGLISSPVLSLDPSLADAVYQNAVAATTQSTAKAERQIHAAVHWHSRAWENSPLHTMPDIIVKLKTSLEALSGKHKTKEGVSPLLDLYKGAAKGPWAKNFLWVEEAHSYERILANGTAYRVSAFEHWYWNLAETRNNIVHETLDPLMHYEAEQSPFSGNLFRVADQVCRELIKIRLSEQGKPELLMSKSERSILDLLIRTDLTPAGGA